MKINIQTTVILLIYICMGGVIVTQTMGNVGMTSTLFAGVMIFSIVFWLLLSKTKMCTIDILAVAMVFFALMNVLIDLLCAEIVVLSDLKKALIFITTILFFSALNKYEMKAFAMKNILRINTLISIWWIITYFFQGETLYMWNGRLTSYLTMGFTNPNLIAAFFLCNALVEAVLTFIEKRKIYKVLHLAIFVFISYLIFCTQSRNCILAWFFFLVGYLFMLIRKKAVYMSNTLLKIIVTFPFTFAVVYLGFVNNAFIQNITAFLVSNGKSILSRKDIWAFAIDILWESPFKGSYLKTLSGTSQTHMHNSHIDVAASYGIPVMILLCIYLYFLLKTIRDRQGEAINMISLWGFSTVIIMGMGESMLFSGGLGIYCYAAIFLLIANYGFTKEGVK